MAESLAASPHGGAVVAAVEGAGPGSVASEAEGTAAVLTGILSARRPVGPPAPEPDDIPLLSVPQAPVGLISDDEVPMSSGVAARQPRTSQPPVEAEAPIPVPTVPPFTEIPEEEESLELLGDQATPDGGAEALGLGPEPAPVVRAGQGGLPATAGARGAVKGAGGIDLLFRMLESQLPENIEKSSDTAGTADGVAFREEEPLPDQDRSPVPEAARPDRGSGTPDQQELDGVLGPDPAAAEVSQEPVAQAPRANPLPSSSHLLGEIGGPVPEASQPFSAWTLSAVRYPVRGKGALVLAIVTLAWVAALLLVKMEMTLVSVPILLLLAALCLGSALAAALHGGAGSQSSPRWPLTTDPGAWSAIMGGLGRFALLA